MRKTLPLALVCVSCIMLGQDQRIRLDGQKQRSNVCSLHVANDVLRYERGCMSGQVDAKRSGKEDVFVVNAGPVFPFKDVKIVGLPEDLILSGLHPSPEIPNAAR
jgi:hypothetical protein